MTLWQSRLAGWVQTACQMEVMCAKPGNVSPGNPLGTMTVADFLRSAAAIAPVLAKSESHPPGETILQAISATRRVVSHNTNLGIVLLIAPLAAVPPERSLIDGVKEILADLTLDDSVRTYQAIRLAEPGGLGEVSDQDLAQPPTLGLRDCMSLAADRDLIARQYANGFTDVLCDGVDLLREARGLIEQQSQQIVWVAIQLMARYGDSLVARKCGPEISSELQRMADLVISENWPKTPTSLARFQQLDQFLRADGHRRNPGTTADFIAAILFAALRDGWLIPEGDWWRPQDSSESAVTNTLAN